MKGYQYLNYKIIYNIFLGITWYNEGGRHNRKVSEMGFTENAMFSISRNA